MHRGFSVDKYIRLMNESIEAVLKLSQMQQEGASNDDLLQQARKVNEAKRALGFEPVDLDVLVSGCEKKLAAWEARQEKIDARRFRVMCQVMPPPVANEMKQRADAAIAEMDTEWPSHDAAAGLSSKLQ